MELVGVDRFELSASSSRTKHSARLSYTPGASHRSRADCVGRQLPLREGCNQGDPTGRASAARTTLWFGGGHDRGREMPVARLLNTFLAGTLVLWCAFGMFIEV